MDRRPGLTLIAERVRIGAGWTSRLGGRVPLGSAFSIDLSVARLGPRSAPVYALGLNHEFAR